MSSDLVALLASRGLTIAVAESLTGGSLVARLIDVPGASATVLGGVVAYNTALKASLLGVSPSLLSSRGPVDAEVAEQMAAGVRVALAVDGRPADVGLATTGVAGPATQQGQPVGTVFIGLAIGDRVESVGLVLSGNRGEIRSRAVDAAIAALFGVLNEAQE